MLSRMATPRRRGRRLLTGLAIAGLVGGTLLAAGAALAVPTPDPFELDGNAVSQTYDDWDKVCHEVLGTDCSTTSNTNGAIAVSFASEGTNESIFTGGGSKDPQAISSWLWKDGSVPDKDNLLNAFAARYTSGGKELLYFGSDRYANDGDAMQGFWFFQSQVTRTNTPSNGGFKFDGAHQTGDLLVISDFSIGGSTSTITVYEWNPDCKKAGASVNGMLCGDANLLTLASSTNANCATAAGTDPYCGIVNAADGAIAPWPFLDKKGFTTFSQGELFEAGIDLTALKLDDRCYSSVMSETRSSTSTTATLKDFALGNFGHCGADLTTTPKLWDGSSASDIPAAGTPITTAGEIYVKDSATLTVSGIKTWSGTLQFYICGPGATSCSDTTGTAVGSAINVSQATTFPVLSDAKKITSAGTYYWAAKFTSSVSGLPGATFDGSDEKFVVNPMNPEISTKATAEVTVGSPIADTATLSGTALPAGGTVTFKLYGPYADATGTCAAGDLLKTFDAVTVTGDGDYSSGNYTPTSAGTYRWVASYSGNLPNTTSVSGTCGDTGETTVVKPKQPSITTNATAGPVPVGTPIKDVATLSGTATKPDGTTKAGGTITFKLYGPYADASGTCAAGDLIKTFDAVTVSGDGDYSSANFTPTAAGTYLWVASYSGDLPNTKAVSGSCGDENEASVVISLQPTIATAQTFVLHDAATITVNDAGAGDLAGSVRFRLYDDAVCSGTVLYDSNTAHPSGIAVAGTGTFPQSVTVLSDDVTITASQPMLSWLVEYTSTNLGHKNVTSSCSVERSSVSINNNYVAP